VDVITTGDGLSTRAAKGATSTISIVMARNTDPVGNGFVASLARPAGNITGLSSIATDLAGKRLELLKEAIPKLSRIAILGDPRYPATALKEAEGAARSLKVQLISVQVRGLDVLENAFRSITKSGADAFILGGSGFFTIHRTKIIELAAKSRLPAMYPEQEYMLAGGLMTYSRSVPTYGENDRRCPSNVVTRLSN
jgi:putative ABC transport system substrate-binding protein